MNTAGDGKSRCPICTGEGLPPDASNAEKQGTIVLLQGEIYAVVDPVNTYTPYSEYGVASLYVRRGSVKYLKFRTKGELDRWGLKPRDKVQLEGCWHTVDGKELVFDVRDVIFDPST